MKQIQSPWRWRRNDHWNSEQIPCTKRCKNPDDTWYDV